MGSKINKRTRIKFYWIDLWNFKKQRDPQNDIVFRDWILLFEKETGLNQTSLHFDYAVEEQVHYFKVVDTKKFFLSKLLYGF